MATPQEYETALRETETEPAQAQTAEDIRKIRTKYYLTLGHRSRGRILTGRPATDLIARHHAKRDEET
jgi:hypothetical protein